MGSIISIEMLILKQISEMFDKSFKLLFVEKHNVYDHGHVIIYLGNLYLDFAC